MLIWPISTLLAKTGDADVLFHIECPSDVTLDCDDEIWDLSGYGWAYVHGYGAPVPASDPVVSYHLNSCNTGYITRTWTAYDYQNNPHSCTQHIYVGQDGGFDESNIHWPPHYMTEDCNAQLDPDDLPYPHNYPTYDDLDCSMIMIGYDDLVFNFGGGCKKILRTWSVLNWCAYNPNDPYAGGRWDHTQIIKIKPNGGIVLSCPQDIETSAGENCSGTYVNVPGVTGGGACGSSLSVTNNSPYAASNGGDASGYYPFGTTWITYTAEDACGNWESCQMKIVIKDMKKPTPICYDGLSTTLMMNEDGYYMDLDAEWFNKGSFDNCTPDHLLRFRIEPSRFTCDQLGLQEVRVYVKDLDGNEQYCRTHVLIQDNMNMCPPIDTTSFSLSGALQTIHGLPMPGIELELMQDVSMIEQTSSDQTGQFAFDQVMNSLDYMIMPRGNDDFTYGLSTFDLLKLAKHVHGVKLVESDGELLAADVDQDGELNVRDVLALRNLLLNRTSTLPNDKAWRFIPTELLDSGDNPLEMDIEEYWSMEELNENYEDIDFTVIKIGDINGSAQNIGTTEERSKKAEIVFEVVQNQNRLDFVSTKALSVSGLQLQLNIGSKHVDQFIPGTLDITNSDVRMLNKMSLVSFIRIEEDASIGVGDILFSLSLKQEQQQHTIELLEELLMPELYSSGDVIYTVKLGQQSEDEIPASLAQAAMITVYPNPAKSEAPIHIVCHDKSIRKVTLYDGQGQVRLTQDRMNLHEVDINSSDLAPGLYLIHVETTEGQVQLEKVVIN